MIARRDFLKFSAFAALPGALRANISSNTQSDYKLEISAVTIDLSPRHRLKTTAYNGQAPGPLLRMKEGAPVSIQVINRTDRPEVVHWHGLFTPSEVDGATEEGTLPIPPGGTARYEFVPRPAGFRWYHTHTMAMGDLSRGQYSGQHGFLWVEPRSGPGRFDREFFLCLHDWSAYLSASDDGAMSPAYALSTINGKTLGFGEPLRVQENELVLFHVLNSSPSEVHWLALAGHDLRVIALDGNAVPQPGKVSMLRLAPAERACVEVRMNNPGIWVFGEVREHVQRAGMGIAVEYADRHGSPRWNQPTDLIWDYFQFATSPAAGSAAARIAVTEVPLVFESVFRGHGAMERYTINGQSFGGPTVAPLLEQGQRYRLQFINKTGDDHPVHLHRHTFELTAPAFPVGTPPADRISITGPQKDVVLVEAHTQMDVEFTAANPGATLFHCHQQSHMDMGFMTLLRYA